MGKRKKPSFLVYGDYQEAVSDLTNEEAGILFKNLIRYFNNEALLGMDGATNMAFKFIKADMDRDNEKYQEKCRKNKENGLKGGRPPKTQENQSVTEKTQGNQSVNGETQGNQQEPKKPDIDIDTDNNTNSAKEETKKEINDFFERVWKLYPKKVGKAKISDTKKKTLYEIGEEELKRAIQRYRDGLSKESWRKPQDGSTFFNTGYFDYLDENYEKPPEQQPERNPASVLSCERDYNFTSIEEQLLKKQWGDDLNT